MAEPRVKFRLLSEEAKRFFDDIGARAGEVKPVMRSWSVVVKKHVEENFRDKAPAKAASTLKKEAATGTGSVTAQGKVRSAYAKKLQKLLERKGTGEGARDLRRLVFGDLSAPSSSVPVERLRKRLRRAQAARAIGARVAIGKRVSERKQAGRGGRMARAFGVKLLRFGVRVINKVPFSAAHDEGGRVGNNATLPEWGFMDIDSATAERLSDLFLDWVLEGKR